MSLSEKITTKGNEKADEQAKQGARLDEGDMSQVRAITVQQGREEVYAVLPCAAGFHCLVEEWKGCEELKNSKPKNVCFRTRKRSTDASNGVVSGSKQMSVHVMRKKQKTHGDAAKEHVKDQSGCVETLQTQAGKMEQITFGRTRVRNKSLRARECRRAGERWSNDGRRSDGADWSPAESSRKGSGGRMAIPSQNSFRKKV